MAHCHRRASGRPKVTSDHGEVDDAGPDRQDNQHHQPACLVPTGTGPYRLRRYRRVDNSVEENCNKHKKDGYIGHADAAYIGTASRFSLWATEAALRAERSSCGCVPCNTAPANCMNDVAYLFGPAGDTKALKESASLRLWRSAFHFSIF